MKGTHWLEWFWKHKMISLIILLMLFGVAFGVYTIALRGKEPVHYSLERVKQGTVIVSVTGTGHVSASNQFDIKSTVNGTVVGVDAANGQHVEEGAVLVRLDDKDAIKTVRDANVNYQSAVLSLKKLKQPPDRLAVLQAQNALVQSKNAKQRATEDLESSRISLQKMTQPPDDLALLQAENALLSAKEALDKAEDNLKKSREDGFNSVANAFLNFPSIMTGLNDMFYVSSIDRNQVNADWYANQITRWDADKVVSYKNDLLTNYTLARDQYTSNFDHYKSSSRASDSQTLEALIVETYETSKRISDTVKAANNYIDLVQNILKEHSYPIPSIISTHKNTLTTYTNQSNASSSDLLSIKQSIEDTKTSIVSSRRAINDKVESLRKLKDGADPLDIQSQKIIIKQKEDAIIDADRMIFEKTESLRKLKDGADPLDIQSQELAVVQREHTLADAQEKLKEYNIRAPFGGEVAVVPVKVNDSLSPANIAITLITAQSIAELSLSEVDVAKVKRAQKVTLTFDAIPDMTITGTVSDIDTVGTVLQGVVTYIVKVSFDTQESSVKPGMSVSGSIVTDIKQGVLVVPNGAVKTRGDISYVSAPSETIPSGETQFNDRVLTAPTREIPVIIGTANDTVTEIVSGLKENDLIITKTVQQRIQSTQAPSLFGSPGGGTRGLNGGATRFGR